jgi:hypothetical protein
MCRNLILLAQNNRKQMVFTCEHGTIHITHQKTTICLAYQDFRQFVELLIEGGLDALNESRLGSIREDGKQQLELWIDSGGLRLSPEDFLALTDVLRLAYRHLDHLPAPTAHVVQPRQFLN